MAPFSETLLRHVGGDLSKVVRGFITFYVQNSLHVFFACRLLQTPDGELRSEFGFVAPQLYSNPEMEEIIVLTLTGHAFMKNFGLYLSASIMLLFPVHYAA